MTADIGMRMQRLISGLTEKHFTYPPSNIGSKTIAAALRAQYIETQEGFKSAIKCRLTQKGVMAKKAINRQSLST